MRRTILPVILFALVSLISAADASAQADSAALLRRGERVWKKKECAKCHGIDPTGSAPALGGVTQRRSREWLYNWLKDTKKWSTEDSTAKALVARYQWLMPKQNLGKEDAEAVLVFIEHRAVQLREERARRSQ